MPTPYTLPLNRDIIKKHLPHRDPMLFIDRVTALEEMYIQAQSDIRPEADFFKGHFPGMPIMPGVLIVETIVQAGALLVSLTGNLDNDKFMAFANMNHVKFKKSVYPGDILNVDVHIERSRLDLYKFSGQAHVGDRLVASLNFSAKQVNFDRT